MNLFILHFNFSCTYYIIQWKFTRECSINDKAPECVYTLICSITAVYISHIQHASFVNCKLNGKVVVRNEEEALLFANIFD
jgi:hypothetical protein